MNIKKIIMILTVIAMQTVLSQFSFAKVDRVWLDTSLRFEERAWGLVDAMTLEEKVSQMMDRSRAIERLGIPEYNWWNEALHGVARSGYATVFPQAIGMAASFDTELMYKTADVISTEARAKYHESIKRNNRNRYYGLTFWSPNINIFRDPRWGRGQETYGEDPYLTGQMGMQFVKGLQGSDPKYFKVVATPKHYAVHNGPEPDRHHFNAVVSKRDLYETYLPAFEDLIVKAKAYSIMGAYNRVDGESASASYMLLEDILRDKWKFEGFVVSDCGAIGDIWRNHNIVPTAEEAAALGARRGCDLNCGSTYKALINAVKDGYIDEAEIDLNMYRLVMAKMKLGMFDPDEMVSYSKIPYSSNDSPANSQVALQMARESIVLLKNENNTLPLDKGKIKTIAVIGPNADNIDSLLGNYNGTPSKPVTVLQGIKDAVGENVNVIYVPGCDYAEGYVDESNTGLIKPELKTGRGSDAVEGLKAEYFNNVSLEGEPVVTRIETDLDHRWEMTSPTDADIAQGIITPDKAVNPDNFSVRWTGVIVAPEDPGFDLLVGNDDGCRVFINSKKVFEDWSAHAVQFSKVNTNMKPGETADIKIEFYDSGQQAQMTLGWKDAASKDSSSNAALIAAKKADAVIFVGGLTARLEGEEMNVNYPGFKGGDRTDIALPQPQREMLQALHATGKPVIFVMMTGSAIACPWSQENIPAILCGWYPGQNGGTAIADVIFGRYNPGGRLPVTFYRSIDQLGDFDDYNMDNKTYRYFTGEPLYAFGYGLSYSTFEYSDLKVSKKEAKASDKIKVSFTVANTSGVDGDEVVQLYVRDVESEISMPLKQLRVFGRIHLKAGESKRVKMMLTPDEDMRYYEPRVGDYAVEHGEFEIQVGAASNDIRLKEVVVVR